MKKYILGIMVAVSLTACGGSVKTEETCDDSTTCVESVDTTKIVADTVKVDSIK